MIPSVCTSVYEGFCNSMIHKKTMFTKFEIQVNDELQKTEHQTKDQKYK